MKFPPHIINDLSILLWFPGIIGALYLLWMGWKALRNKEVP